MSYAMQPILSMGLEHNLNPYLYNLSKVTAIYSHGEISRIDL
jgi:hypothetical protein